MYRVTLENTFTGLTFDFLDFGDAVGFIGLAIENGSYSKIVGVEPVKATISCISSEEVGLNE